MVAQQHNDSHSFVAKNILVKLFVSNKLRRIGLKHSNLKEQAGLQTEVNFVSRRASESALEFTNVLDSFT